MPASDMGKRKKRREKGSDAPVRGPSRARLLAVVGVMCAAALLAWATWRPTSGPAGPKAAASVPQSNAPPAAAPDFAVLLGEWTRPDGGYVLSVQQVAPDGQATVGYYNPRPIRVSKAQARKEGEHVGLFVELNDVNYPGSTYTSGTTPPTAN